jgi:hypothetical protein
MSFAAPVLLTLASLGAGFGILALLRVIPRHVELEQTALAFAIGFGVVGWLFFWLAVSGQLIQPLALLVCGVLSLGLFSAGRPKRLAPLHLSNVEKLLAGLLGAAFLLDGLEAFAPAVEADSLAYHFELPRRFIEQGELFFVPRVLDGAVPMLVQMTYMAAMLISGGDETGLTLWVFISGWGAGVALFALSRRWLARSWAMALWLLFQTTPAMLYSAGSGHVEPRIAMFVLVTVYGLALLRETKSAPPIILIALASGFFAASKYTGLLFVAAAGSTVFFFSRDQRVRNSVVFVVAAAAAGGQWYGWNFQHTGDPVFPVLFNALGLPDGPYWDRQHALEFKAYLQLRYDQIAWWQRWLAYPLAATLFPPPAIEAGRVGFGPFILLAAPMALVGLWQQRQRIARSPLLPALVVIVLYYFLWLHFGGVPKVRHLLPVLPLILMGVTILARAGLTSGLADRSTFPLALALAASLAINFAAFGFYSLPYVKYAADGFPSGKFLRERLNGYPAAAALNRMPAVKKVLITYRGFLYYIDPPSLFVFPHVQKQIRVAPGKVDPSQFWNEVKRAGITHILTDRPVSMSFGPKSVESAIRFLEEHGCLTRLRRIELPWHQSRTLHSLQSSSRAFEILLVENRNCR